MMQFLRSCLYTPIFYLGSLYFVVGALILFPFSRDGLFAMSHGWGRYHERCARIFLGIKTRVEGEFHDEPVLYVIKHESMFETVETLRLFHRPAVVMKAELAKIPLWGAVARHFGVIPVDRTGGASTMREMITAARRAIAEGRPIVLFPEGTRVPHGERAPLQSGFAGLYKLLNIPVVPVALNSGLLSPRGSFVKKAGTITYKIGETIPPGLPRKEIEERVHEAINALNTPKTVSPEPVEGRISE